jgi:hypothetical protein
VSLGFALVAAASSLSCSLLVKFDDVPGGACDGGLCGYDGAVQADGGIPDAAPDGAGDDGPAMDTGGSDAGADHYAPCSGLTSGAYCATDGLKGYAGSQNDLVHCVDGGIGSVTSCAGGCLKMPNPFPDACEPCTGKADGSYCGRDFTGFPAADADFLIQCQLGNVVQSVACAHGCGSAGTSSACYP